jgi:hypothetical protein
MSITMTAIVSKLPPVGISAIFSFSPAPTPELLKVIESSVKRSSPKGTFVPTQTGFEASDPQIPFSEVSGTDWSTCPFPIDVVVEEDAILVTAFLPMTTDEFARHIAGRPVLAQPEGRYFVWHVSTTVSGSVSSSGIIAGPMSREDAFEFVQDKEGELLSEDEGISEDICTRYEVRVDDGYPDMAVVR